MNTKTAVTRRPSAERSTITTRRKKETKANITTAKTGTSKKEKVRILTFFSHRNNKIYHFSGGGDDNKGAHQQQVQVVVKDAKTESTDHGKAEDSKGADYHVREISTEKKAEEKKPEKEEQAAASQHNEGYTQKQDEGHASDDGPSYNYGGPEEDGHGKSAPLQEESR